MMDALDKLIEAVEAVREDFGLLEAVSISAPLKREMRKAYNGSLDAALALHEALLPGWAIDRMVGWPGGEFYVQLLETHEDENGDRWHGSAEHKAEASDKLFARAWLLAILRAYRSTQP